MKKLYFTFAIALFSMLCTAQDLAPDSSWKVEGYGAVNLNQVSFTNWAAGGDNSISFTLVGFLQAKYARNKHNWDNSANLQFGLIRTDEFGLRKNEDKIELESKYGYILNKKETLLLSVLGNFKSQFANGYNYPNDSVVISKFAAPGYLTVGIGLDWKPKDYFSLFISPATGKITFIRDNKIASAPLGAPGFGAYGNEIDTITGIGENQVYQFGAYLNAKFQKEIVKNITLLTKLELFQNYTGDTDESKMIDVNWETAFLFKVNEWLAASLTLNLIYDKEISIPKDENDNGTSVGEPNEFDDRVQFKEALSLGLTYKFNNKKRTGRAE